MILILIIIAWLICGFLGAGFYWGHFQKNPNWPDWLKEKDYRRDLSGGFLWVLFGLPGLITSIFCTFTCEGSLRNWALLGKRYK